MRRYLDTLITGRDLTESEASGAMELLLDPATNDSQRAAFLSLMSAKGMSLPELTGIHHHLFERRIPVDLSEFHPIDLCGTGGDGKGTFNISTISALIVAGAGVPVAKHGNHGATSSLGSSTLLEHLGIPLTSEESWLRRQLSRSGICFLHAPLFYPAAKALAPVRKALGVPTFMNLLGPLLNPAGVRRRVVGVTNRGTARLFGSFLEKREGEFAVVHSLDGYDEISLTGEVEVVSRNGWEAWMPEDHGFDRIVPESIRVDGSVEASATICLEVLEGRARREQENVVVANAGLAIHVALGRAMAECFEMAREAIRSGRAKETLENLQEGK